MRQEGESGSPGRGEERREKRRGREEDEEEGWNKRESKSKSKEQESRNEARGEMAADISRPGPGVTAVERRLSGFVRGNSVRGERRRLGRGD